MMITHELKQPLTPIVGYAQLIRDQLKTDEQKKYLERIVVNSNRMKDISIRFHTA
jgi:signal transduction histidine kinase